MTVLSVFVSGGTEGHLAGLSSSSGQSKSSSGENQVVDGGSQDLSHSEQDDSSEKMGLISEAASPPGSPEQPPADLASAISSWVQFEDDAPWASVSPPHKETGGRLKGFWLRSVLVRDAGPWEVVGLPGFHFACSRALKHWPPRTERAESSSGFILQMVSVT